jgi:hypothetical protein
MRSIAFITIVLLGAGSIACLVNMSHREIAHLPSRHWRRTVDGWEMVVVDANTISIIPRGPRDSSLGDLWTGHPHPLLVSLLLPMLSALLLIAASPETRAKVHSSDSGGSGG